MLVSDRADARRVEVRLGRRPCPEYLLLEERHGVEVLDWSRLGDGARSRSARLSVAHAAVGWRRLEELDVVFSDGEHVGVPLALAMRASGRRTPHLMLGHHLTTGQKRRVFRLLRPQERITRILVHSRRQLALIETELGVPPRMLRFVPYFADTRFWTPQPVAEEALVVSAGREHRDYSTLTAACARLPARVFVAAGSLFSPGARYAPALAWPDNASTGSADHLELRAWYARASVVAVPLVPNDFQAGVTTLLEAMSMGKAVVVTATEGQRDIVQDGVTGLTVPPGDVVALREAIAQLLADPSERARLGANARELVTRRFSLDVYVDELARHLTEISHAARSSEQIP
jgi:glycosyltransferase involved in cell wall biosynthesis